MLKQIFPFVGYLRARSKIVRALEDMENQAEGKSLDLIKSYAEADPETLGKWLDDEHKRAAAIDDKTFKFASSIATALTLSSAAVTLVTQLTPNVWFKALILIPSVLSIMFAVIAAFFGFAAAGNSKTYGIGPGAKIGWVRIADEKQRSLSIAHALACQEKVYLLKVARNQAAFMCLRNSLILVIVSVTVSIAVLAIWQKPSANDIEYRVHEIHASKGCSTTTARFAQIDGKIPSRMSLI